LRKKGRLGEKKGRRHPKEKVHFAEENGGNGRLGSKKAAEGDGVVEGGKGNDRGKKNKRGKGFAAGGQGMISTWGKKK